MQFGDQGIELGDRRGQLFADGRSKRWGPASQMLFENPDQPLPDEDEVVRTGRLRSALRVHEQIPLESDGPIDQFAPSCIKDE